MSNPISLNATFRDNAVFVSDCVSRSIIRGIIDEFYRETDDENLYYWPSYEMLMYCSMFVTRMYEKDMRHPTENAINMTMNYFDKYYLRS